MGAKLFHAERQTDMTKLIVTYCNYAHARKRFKLIYIHTRVLQENENTLRQEIYASLLSVSSS